MECVPDPKDKLLRLRDGEATIRCTAVEGIDKQESAYVTQLFIQLDYGYTVSKSEQIRIKGNCCIKYFCELKFSRNIMLFS